LAIPNNKKKWFIFFCILIALFILPLLIRDPFYVDIMIMVTLNCMIALTWRVIMRLGQFSFGHAAFVGIGAYASALMVTKLGISFWISLPLSGLITAFISLMIGFPTLRLKGMFFAMTTWSFNEITRAIYIIFKKPFGGMTGLYGIPAPNSIHFPGLFEVRFDSKTEFCYLAFVLFLITFLVLYRIEKSRIGMKFDAIRVDDDLAESVGINLMKHKCLAFAIACFFAGVAGSFYAHYFSFISPNSFETALSVNAIVYGMVGGLGSIFGPLLGASILTVIPIFLHAAGFFKIIIYGVFLIAIILFLPEGLISLPERAQMVWQQTKRRNGIEK
jgi:branched-chain amino acid transport system permease protein